MYAMRNHAKWSTTWWVQQGKNHDESGHGSPSGGARENRAKSAYPKYSNIKETEDFPDSRELHHFQIGVNSSVLLLPRPTQIIRALCSAAHQSFSRASKLLSSQPQPPLSTAPHHPRHCPLTSFSRGFSQALALPSLTSGIRTFLLVVTISPRDIPVRSRSFGP
jgi:hypothetical protein